MPNLELVAALSDADQARKLAHDINGTMLCDGRAEPTGLPFTALVFGGTDNLSHFLDVADIGAYLTYRRVIKPRKKTTREAKGEAVGIFAMIARPGMGHQQADEHWRDIHAPLALSVHLAMSHYTQLSIVHRFLGPDWDGFALCGFNSFQDLKEKFFASEAGKTSIANDVAKFSDGRNSPRRVIATEFIYPE